MLSVSALGKGRIQNEDIKSLPEIVSAGGSMSQLPNASKVYVDVTGINKQLTTAITDGSLGNKALPSQTGNAGRYLATDGSLISWEDISGLSGSITDVSGAYTATALDDTLQFTATATLTLPAIASVPGKKYTIISNSGVVGTIDGDLSEQICGRNSIIVSGFNDSIQIQNNGTSWLDLSGKCRRTDSVVFTCSTSGSGIVSQTTSMFTGVSNGGVTGRCTLSVSAAACPSAVEYCSFTNIESAATGGGAWLGSIGGTPGSSISLQRVAGNNSANGNGNATCTCFR